MTEIVRTLAILKARWPEVILLISLNLSLSLSNLIWPEKSELIPIFLLLYSCFLLTLSLISIMLYAGFQRTVFLEGSKRQSPLVLLRAGKHFFWRMLGIGLLLGIAYFILAWPIFLITKQFTSMNTGFFEAAKVASLAYQLCFIAATLIVMKPLLFIPALIIVIDCRIVKSFKLLKYCKLLNAKELVVLFSVSIILLFLQALLPRFSDVKMPSQYILTIVPIIIRKFVWLIMLVMAVKFVASLDLVYDSSLSSPNSQDLPEEQFKSSLED